ncbi:hypothetical protein IMSAG049_00931 [Clostridiales bacterium]|nr:hypothetical protein IMSAG049_00931 [Clostridiales bacterium]
MSKITNNAKINEEKININRNAIEHRATWTGLTYVEGVKAGLPIEGVIREAIAKTGAFHGTGYKAQTEKPEDLSSFAKAFLPELGLKTFEMDVVKEDADNLEIEFHYCHSIEKTYVLECSRHSQCGNFKRLFASYVHIIKYDFSLSRSIYASYVIEESRLSCTVGAYYTDYFSFPQFKVNIIYSDQSTEALGNAFCF